MSSIERLGDAYKAVAGQSEIRALLREEGGTRHSLTISQRVSGSGIETSKFQHYIKGLEVVGSMAMHHRGGRTGNEVRDSLARFDLNLQPKLTADEAGSLARGVAGDRSLVNQPELKILPSDDGDSARLVYWVKLDKQGTNPAAEVIIDAQSGEVVANLSTLMPIAQVQVFSAQDQGIAVRQPNSFAGNAMKETESPGALEWLKRSTSKNATAVASAQCEVIDSETGAPVSINAKACQMTVDRSQALPQADEASREALDNSERVLDYYKRVHGRDSYDNRGSEVVNVVHVGTKFDNAAWISDQNIMIYGDGDGKELGSFTAALDVAGHEMTHGVTAHTAKLIYMGESGALNEAYSDFFGKMIENRGDWVLGRDLYLDHSHADGFRDMANPGRLMVRIHDKNGNPVPKPYPAKYSEKFVATGSCDGSNDHCYVHINSTIPSHASYLIFNAIGKDKAEKIYYLALTQMITAKSTFKKAALATQSACTKLYDSSTCAKVKNAFTQVGL